ncbi:MAG: redoxin domain-containing protein [Polyangiales bacterium]
MRISWLVFGLALGCGHAAREPSLATRPPHAASLTSGAKLTVVTFFSATCPCQSAHDERLRRWHTDYSPRGVRFVSIDAERGASPEHDGEEAKKRLYPFEIVSDPKGVLADELGARYATYTVILDGEGRIRYEGGLDSDRTHLTEGADLWLRDALDALLAGHEPPETKTKGMGCALHRD